MDSVILNRFQDLINIGPMLKRVQHDTSIYLEFEYWNL